MAHPDWPEAPDVEEPGADQQDDAGRDGPRPDPRAAPDQPGHPAAAGGVGVGRLGRRPPPAPGPRCAAVRPSRCPGPSGPGRAGRAPAGGGGSAVAGSVVTAAGPPGGPSLPSAVSVMRASWSTSRVAGRPDRGSHVGASAPAARWVPNSGRNTQVRRMANRMTAAPALADGHGAQLGDQRASGRAARVAARAPVVKARLTPSRAAAVTSRWRRSRP